MTQVKKARQTLTSYVGKPQNKYTRLGLSAQTDICAGTESSVTAEEKWEWFKAGIRAGKKSCTSS